MNRMPVNRDAIRNAVIRAAISEFSENGYGRARISSIVDDVGISSMRIYYYIGDKKKIYSQVFESVFTEITGGFLDGFFNMTEKWCSPPEESFTAFLYMVSGFPFNRWIIKVKKLFEQDILDGGNIARMYCGKLAGLYLDKIKNILAGITGKRNTTINPDMFILHIISLVKNKMVIDMVLSAGNENTGNRLYGREEFYLTIHEFASKIIYSADAKTFMPLLDVEKKRDIDKLLDIVSF